MSCLNGPLALWLPFGFSQWEAPAGEVEGAGEEVDVFNPMTSSSFPGAGLQWLLFFS